MKIEIHAPFVNNADAPHAKTHLVLVLLLLLCQKIVHEDIQLRIAVVHLPRIVKFGFLDCFVNHEDIVSWQEINRGDYQIPLNDLRTKCRLRRLTVEEVKVFRGNCVIHRSIT